MESKARHFANNHLAQNGSVDNAVASTQQIAVVAYRQPIRQLVQYMSG